MRADGDLYALGFRIPSTADQPKELEVDVVRAGKYLVIRAPGALASEGRAEATLAIGGRPFEGGAVWLDVGRYRVEIPARSPALILTPLPEEVFDPQVSRGAVYSPLLDFGQ